MAGPAFRAIPNLESFVAGFDLVEQALGALNVHQLVIDSVGDQSRAGDVLRDPGHREGIEYFPRFIRCGGADDAL